MGRPLVWTKYILLVIAAIIGGSIFWFGLIYVYYRWIFLPQHSDTGMVFGIGVPSLLGGLLTGAVLVVHLVRRSRRYPNPE